MATRGFVIHFEPDKAQSSVGSEDQQRRNLPHLDQFEATCDGPRCGTRPRLVGGYNVLPTTNQEQLVRGIGTEL